MNVISQYKPKLVGICTTCLAETIGDDVKMFIHQIKVEYANDALPLLVATSTPSYAGSHLDGFRRAVAAVVAQVCEPSGKGEHINILSSMVSPEDLRTLKDIMQAFGLDYVLLPDYSDRLDGQIWEHYQSNIDHGTDIEKIKTMADAKASIEFGFAQEPEDSAGIYLNKTHGVEIFKMPLPIGLRLCDAFFDILKELSSKDIPAKYKGLRGRLIDAYVDGHKYLFGKKALVYGNEDLVISMASFLSEIGIIPAICATGDNSKNFAENIRRQAPESADKITVMNDTDFSEMLDLARSEGIDIVIGNSNGYKLSRELDIPLIRVCLPVHDRIGAARIRHIGYEGTLELFDRIVNAFIEQKQNRSPVGYTHV